MTTSHQGRVGEQHQSYRKGLVLGLTMAEVAILIIFVLLLLLVFNERQRATLVDQLGGRDPSSLLRHAQAFDKLAAAFGPMPSDTSRDFDRLVSGAAEAIQRPGTKAALSAASQALQDIARARAEIESTASAAGRGGIDSLLARIEEQAYAIANQQGQIVSLQEQLKAAGRGGELPSCWADQGGRIDYVYDVVLSSNGIRVRQIDYGQRLNERMLITSWVPDPSVSLTEEAFLERTQPWYTYSQRRDCRFFVDIYDATGPQEKLRYKALLKAVEGHFYKRLNNSVAPF